MTNYDVAKRCFDQLIKRFKTNVPLYDQNGEFRQHRVAFMADITKAFLQISIREQDRDVLRFLWSDDFPKTHEEVNISIMRMTRVPFGASPSPFLLAPLGKISTTVS